MNAPLVHNKYHGTADPDAVYIGRGSPFGNPFKIGDPHPVSGEPMDRATVIALHSDWVHDQPDLLDRIRQNLAGRDLVCFCKPAACHGDTLLAIANPLQDRSTHMTALAGSSTPGVMFSGDLGFLSNFYVGDYFHVPALGADARSGEHAFNALKTTEITERQHVLIAPTPSEAKRRGRRVTLRPGWDTGGRVRAMQQVLVAKFAVPHLREALVGTGDLALVETNAWHDDFWGDCRCPKHANTPGKNMLGELLMALRTRYQAGS